MKIDPRVDPELLPTLEQFPPTELNLDNLAATREMQAEQTLLQNTQLPEIDGVIQEDRLVPGLVGNPEVRIRIYKPVGQTGDLPCLLWMHGGGYVIGNIDKDDYRNQLRVKTLGCTVVSVDYRLAPESPYPSAIEDCYSALKWIYENAAELRIDNSRIAVGGVSAGGGLAATLALLARDRKEIEVAFQLLIYPMIDDQNIAPASDILPDTLIWSRAKNRFGWNCYLSSQVNSKELPIYAAAYRGTDLTRIPPAIILVGDLDIFVDENIEYARRLIQARIPTELHVYPGAYHGFASFAPMAKVSQECNNACNQALKKAFELDHR